MIPLNEDATIPEEAFSIVDDIIKSMNIVLSQIVPGLTIKVKNMGPQTLQDGTAGCKVQLMSCKNSKEIALQYESEGIKKIITIFLITCQIA